MDAFGSESVFAFLHAWKFWHFIIWPSVASGKRIAILFIFYHFRTTVDILIKLFLSSQMQNRNMMFKKKNYEITSEFCSVFIASLVELILRIRTRMWQKFSYLKTIFSSFTFFKIANWEVLTWSLILSDVIIINWYSSHFLHLPLLEKEKTRIYSTLGQISNQISNLETYRLDTYLYFVPSSMASIKLRISLFIFNIFAQKSF